MITNEKNVLYTQLVGQLSVPAHVEMMGLIGMGNNPMVGASVAFEAVMNRYDKNYSN